MNDPDPGARVGEDGSFVYRDYEDRDHAYADVHELARDWWSDSPTRGSRDWRTRAHPLVADLLEAGHPASIDVLQAIVDQAGSDDELVFVGAGPMEDLLSHHGHADAFVDEVESRGRRQPRFRTAVGGLWLSQDVRESVRIRLGRLGAAELGAARQDEKGRKPRRARKV